MATLVLESLGSLPNLTDTAISVGSYDGVHTGHQAMIARLCEQAGARGLSSLLITFQPHYRIFLGRACEPFLLTDTDEKIALLEKTGADTILVLPFTRPLARMTAEEFLRTILAERLGCKLLLVGHDQAIGRDQVRGATEIAKAARPVGTEIVSMEPLMKEGQAVSSTRIRSLVRGGKVLAASRLLGYRYFLTGRVVPGEGRGRGLGYPTANIAVNEPLKLVPAEGIYLAVAEIPTGTAQGMLYVGRRPTFGDGPRMIELFLLDFDGDLYDKPVRIHVLEWLRGDMTFDTAEALVRQIRADEACARELYRAMGPNPMAWLDGAPLTV